MYKPIHVYAHQNIDIHLYAHIFFEVGFLIYVLYNLFLCLIEFIIPSVIHDLSFFLHLVFFWSGKVFSYISKNRNWKQLYALLESSIVETPQFTLSRLKLNLWIQSCVIGLKNEYLFLFSDMLQKSLHDIWKIDKWPVISLNRIPLSIFPSFLFVTILSIKVAVVGVIRVGLFINGTWELLNREFTKFWMGLWQL